jgi:hypothetical protein
MNTDEKQFKALDLIEAIDWVKLRHQKKALIMVISNSVDYTTKSRLNGILDLLDNLQDFAVDTLDKNETDIFTFED